MCDLSRAELLALYAAARWGADPNSEGVWPIHMRQTAGNKWRSNLRRALAVVSREMATQAFTKRRK